MNKFIPVIFVSAFVFVGAGCGSNNSNPQPTSQPAAQNGAPVNGGSFLADSNSLGDLVKQGKSVKCVLLKSGPYIASETTYISHGKMRSDETLAGPDGVPVKGPGNAPIATHSIIDGTSIYSWEDDHKDQATKSTMEELQKLGGATSTPTQAPSTADVQNFTCSNWFADASLFTPPADINFRSFKEVMCAPCEKISDATYKAQCKKSIGC